VQAGCRFPPGCVQATCHSKFLQLHSPRLPHGRVASSQASPLQTCELQASHHHAGQKMAARQAFRQCQRVQVSVGYSASAALPAQHQTELPPTLIHVSTADCSHCCLPTIPW
jgi:hypothetical protein